MSFRPKRTIFVLFAGVAIIISVIYCGLVFSYDTEVTHPFLTEKAVELFNKNSEIQISQQQLEWLKQGAIEEDTPLRWMNHFYNPQTGKGLWHFSSAKDWSRENIKQSLYPRGNQTWQKAVSLYVEGKEQEAFIALGHILHLIEDMAVPAHTRLDAHPEGDPYEEWVKSNTDKEIKAESISKLNNIDEFFDFLAGYSNKYFLSKDTITINNNFQEKIIDKKVYLISQDDQNNFFKLIEKKIISGKIFYNIENDFVHSDYYSLLAPKAISYGAGVVNLFFQEVEKAKQDPNFVKTEEKSFLAKALEATDNLINQAVGFVSEIFKNDQGFQPAGEVNLNQSQDSPISGDQTSNIASQNIKQCSFNVSQSPSRQKMVINEVAWMGGVNSANDEWIELENISNTTINLSGYQLIDQAEQIKIIFDSNDKIPANGFYLLEKTDDSAVPNIKADKIYTGQLSNTNEGLRLFDSNCNLIDEILANPNWPAGDNKNKKTMERNSANFSWYTSSVIGGTPRQTNSNQQQTTDNKQQIIQEQEESEDNEEIAPQQKEQIKQQEQIQQATSSPQQTQQTVIFKQCAFQTNQSPSRQKVIINEVAWMGTTNSANDEWIELKNISGSEVDLNGWQLLDADEEIKVVFGKEDKRKIINKRIPANGFYLLERTDDDSVPGITADFVYTGALSNDSKTKLEGLRLFDSNCNLIDEVLATSGSDGKQWPAGDNTTAAGRKTMERKSDFTWYTSSIIGGTPKRENSTPAVVYSGGGGGGMPSNNQQQTTNDQQQIKILINEIQLAGATADDEFIELYNYGNSTIDLTALPLKLHIRNSNGTDSHKTLTFINTTISAKGYFLVGPASGYTGTASLDATYLTSGNKLVNNGGAYISKSVSADADILDKVGWGTQPTGGYETSPFAENPVANESIQRKFQDNTFVDTDNNTNDFEIQSCPSPKAPSKTCQQANQAPSAFFVYTPQNPTVGETITFNAASSTDSDGQIISYQWDFGDPSASSGQATSSISTATTTYSYSTAGNYTVQLIVFDNKNASSTATSTVISVASSTQQLSQDNHLVISEIQVKGEVGAADDEFIEIYNPTDSAVPLSGYSIQYLSGTATSTVNIQKKNFTSSARIASKSFFLLVNNNATSSLLSKKDMDYSFGLSGNQSGATIFLVNATTSISSINDLAIIDSLSYGNPQLAVSAATSTVPDSNKSLERKAWQNNQCLSSQLDGEFLGNGCDRDYDNDYDYDTSDFEIRDIPNPQNSSSFPEPRNAPTMPENFSVQYSSSTMELVFNWDASQDYSSSTLAITYKITDISPLTNSGQALSTIETASTTAKISISETGRDYKFSIQAFDKEGLGSDIAASTITINPITILDTNFYLLNQAEINPPAGGLRSDLGRVGQVFKPLATGVIDSIILKLTTSGSYCSEISATIYEWLSSAANNPDGAKGRFLTKSNNQTICSNTAYPNPRDFGFDFVGSNEIILESGKYYFLEIASSVMGLTTTWLGSDDGSLIDGDAWAEYSGQWQNPPFYSRIKDLYLIMPAVSNGRIEITSPAPHSIFDTETIFFSGTYLEPFDRMYDTLQFEIHDFHTGEAVNNFFLPLIGNDLSMGIHNFSASFEINRPGFFKTKAKLADCSSGNCQLGPNSSEIYFSISGAPLPDGVLLNQTHHSQSALARSDLGLVGQVFQLEKQGIVDNITFKLTTSGSGCSQNVSLNIYEWNESPEISPLSARGNLLASAGPREICHNTAYVYPWNPSNFTFDFTGENEIILESGKYYYLEIVHNGPPTTSWFGSENGSLIRGQVWVTYNGAWQTPPSYSSLRDLYLVINMKVGLEQQTPPQ